MLQNLIQGPLNINEENLRVKDVLVNGVWDFSCISFDVSPQLVHSIKAIPVRSASFNIDSIIWASSSCGEFDPRNAYNLVATISVPPIQFDGAWIWKLDIIPKIKFFLWKCWLQCLPTSSNLVHRAMPIDPKCMACQNREESIIHVLRDCIIARNFWAVGSIPYSFSDFYDLDFKAWLYKFCNFNTKDHSGSYAWKTYFLRGIWALWIQRNNMLFKHTSPNLDLGKSTTGLWNTS